MINKIKQLFFIFLILLSLNSFVKAEQQIEKILKNQTLTVFDLGLLRLKDDLKAVVPFIDIREFKYLPANIYTEALYSSTADQILLIVAVPMERNLNKKSYMADSITCRKIYTSVKENLLNSEGYSNTTYRRAASYLTNIFTPPSKWASWRNDEKLSKQLVEFVKLEITLKPTSKYAVLNKVRPFTCEGNLASSYEDVKITRRFN